MMVNNEVNSAKIQVKHKVSSILDNAIFIKSKSYKKIYELFNTLKTSRGKIIHIIGAPGTGKSTNIYFAIYDLDLKYYEPKFILKDENASPLIVFNKVIHELKKDLGVKSSDELFQKLSQYDAILFADKFHDTHLNNDKMVGFSRWTDSKGFRSFYFYWLCIKEYFSQREKFKNINIVFQTAWRIYIRGEKYDLFSDLGVISLIFKKMLNLFFDVVTIAYTDEEIIKIVKAHYPTLDEREITKYIKKYGLKPRYILSHIEKDYNLKNG
jgi:GTPase SAR1 family protein